MQQETQEGIVQEALPNLLFRIGVADNQVLAYLSGRMRKNKIKVLVGDKVELVIDKYGGKARIVKRL